MDEPKKYIRTLAGDMKTLQEGGTPDLAPLMESKTSPTAHPDAASPVLPTPAPSQIPSSNIGHVSSSPLSIPTVKIESLPVIAPVEPPRSVEAPSVEPKPIPLETYARDFSDRMKETHASTATVLAAEQDSAPVSQREEEPESSKKNLIYVIAGAVLIIIGGSGVYFAYTHYYASAPLPILTENVQAPIFVDEREQISGTGTVLLQAIEQSLTRPLAPHTIRFLYVASSTDSIFSALPLSAPDILKRNVNAVGSMAGVITVDDIQSPFFILSVATYRDTFAGMLSWEKTMPNTLAGLFPPYASSIITTATATTTVTATTTASTTSTSSGQATMPGFRDEMVSNHDVRIYRDTLGQSVVIYGYWNQTTLIIARDPAAFAEILTRLATSRLPAQAGTQP